MLEEKRFTLRMDASLFNEISDAANKHRRSTAKEIEHAIALYLKDLAEKDLLDNIDTNKISNEEAKIYIKKIKDIRNKYKTFME